METADVVVIGAGVNGTSTAFHLAKAGAGKVIVLERRNLASGATGKSGALVRTHYTNEPETRLAFESMKYFQNWQDMVGGECGYTPVGLMVFTPPETHEHLETNVAMHRAVGANAQITTAAEAKALDPSLYVDDVTHVAYEPESGYADPNATTFSFAKAAMREGVEFRFDTEVLRVLTSGERVTGVETSQGVIETANVVVAAGAWANFLFQPLSIDLGLVPSTSRITIFRWPFDRSARHLTYIDRVNHMWVRPIDGNCTLCGAETADGRPPTVDPNDYAETVSQEYVALCRATLSRRFPVMAHSTMRGNWACALMQSPDSRPIIDQLPQYEGLFCMAGDSGTSFKTAPAIGKCLAEWVTEGRPRTVDLAPFRSTRFAEGKPWRDEYDYNIERATISR